MNKKRFSAAALALVMAMSSTNVLAANAGENSLVVRDDLNLSDRTIAGDVIVAEEIDRLGLNKVNVGGMVDVREEVENLSVANSAINGGILVRDEADITVKAGNVNKIETTESSEELEVQVNKKASVDEIHLNGEEAEISGRGTVGVVYVNAGEAEISTPNTKVIVGENADEVEAGGVELNPGDSVVINPNGNGVKPVEPKPEQPQLPEAQLADAAKIVDLGWSRFVAVDFAEGNSLSNCTLTVDGVDVTAATTNVTDNGSMVKWEITGNHKELVISNGVNQQTVALGGKGAAPEVVLGQTPDYFLMNGPVYVWDYHLTNYDESGNIRYNPEKTTFDLDGVSSASIAHHSPDAVLHHDENALPYFVKGEVQLMFNYAQGTEAEKAFVDGITDVDLVAFNEYNNTLNDQLHYSIDKDFVHGDHTVAAIKVPLGQVNFTSNGRYNLRVTSNGVAKLFPIHVVEEVVPTMTVTGDQGYYGNEVHFRIENMTYGVTRPVYRVELTNPDGQTSTLAKFDDWFLHGDLLVLYNTIHNYFPETGSYTVKVWADGFQPFELTFWQNAIVSKGETPVTYDAISTASVGGGGSSGGGSGEGDSKFMNANLIVDTDLMVNAQVITQLGLTNEAANGIAGRWDTMTKLYAFNEGAEQVYTYDDFCNAYNAAAAKGQYLTFAQYIASEGAVTTLNRPYSVKRVLEDNLLGETTGFMDSVGKPASAMTVVVTGETAAITVADEAYLAAVVAEGQLTLDGNSLPLQNGKDFTVNGNVITLNKVEYGVHDLAIRVPGYQTGRVTFERVYPMEEVALTAADITKGEPMVITCTAAHETTAPEVEVCDFLAHVTEVQLIAPNGNKDDVMPEGAESVFDKIGYTVEGNTLTIGKDTLDQAFAQNADGSFAAGEYKVIITAEYYGDKTVTLNVADAPEQPGTNATPAVSGMKLEGGIMGQYYRTSFEGENIAAYLDAITSITLNGEAAKKVTNLFGETKAFKLSNDPAYGGENKFVDFTTDCFTGTVEVVISASGYEDLTFTVVNGQVEIVRTEAPVIASIDRLGGIMGQYDRISFQGDVTEYLPAITSITLDGVEAKQVTDLFNETKAYKFSNDPAFGGADKFIDFTTDCFTGTVKVVIKATGYEDLTFTVENGVLLKAVPGFQNFKFQEDMFRGDHYRLSFNTVDAVTSATGGNGGGGVGPIIPPLPEPTPEMKELYNYVSALKTYLNEVKDSSITIDGVEVEESTNATLNDSNSFLVIADEHDMSRNAVVFNLDCFDNKENAEVVIKVAGYEDLVLTVSGRKVEVKPDPQPEPEKPQGDLAAPVVADIQHKLSAFSGNSFVIKMTAPKGITDNQYVYNFLKALTEVSVNGTVFTEAASFGSLANNQYRLNASAGELVLSENALGKGVGEFAVSMKAKGYAPLTFTVKDGTLVK